MLPDMSTGDSLAIAGTTANIIRTTAAARIGIDGFRSSRNEAAPHQGAVVANCS